MPVNTPAQSQSMADTLMRLLDDARRDIQNPNARPNNQNRSRFVEQTIPANALLMAEMNVIEAAVKKVKLLKVKTTIERMDAPPVRGRTLEEKEGYTSIAAESIAANFKEGKLRNFKEFKKNILNHINSELSSLNRILQAA